MTITDFHYQGVKTVVNLNEGERGRGAYFQLTNHYTIHCIQVITSSHIMCCAIPVAVAERVESPKTDVTQSKLLCWLLQVKLCLQRIK